MPWVVMAWRTCAGVISCQVRFTPTAKKTDLITLGERLWTGERVDLADTFRIDRRPCSYRRVSRG